MGSPGSRSPARATAPVWSGNETRHRLNRGGNRQVNAALHLAGSKLDPYRDDVAEMLDADDEVPATGSPTRCSVASLSTRHSLGARRCGGG